MGHPVYQNNKIICMFFKLLFMLFLCYFYIIFVIFMSLLINFHIQTNLWLSTNKNLNKIFFSLRLYNSVRNDKQITKKYIFEGHNAH